MNKQHQLILWSVTLGSVLLLILLLMGYCSLFSDEMAGITNSLITPQYYQVNLFTNNLMIS